MDMNDPVWVQLTKTGWEIFDAHHSDVGLDPAPYRRIIDLDQVGWQKFQLWELLQIFGPSVRHDMWPLPFERNEIRYVAPDEFASRSGE